MILRLLLPALTCLVLAGCPSAPPAPRTHPAARAEPTPITLAAALKASGGKPQAGPLPTTPVNLSALEKASVEQLLEGHRQAVAQGRLMAPADNNAALYELALRHRTGAAHYQDMLVDLAPLVVLRAEAAIADGDTSERDRYVALLEAIDPALPALPRLRATPLGTAQGFLAPVDHMADEDTGAGQDAQDGQTPSPAAATSQD